MHAASFDVVTGAFGYIGRHIAQHLLDAGRTVQTLTGHPHRPNPFGGRVTPLPFHFEHPAELAASLHGADTLYNTYWVRFAHGGVTFDQAVANSVTLLRAAQAAGVRRVVHISITNPTLHSPWPYFHGKAVVEEFVGATCRSFAVLRPTVVFGGADILINNIAWLLRKLPVFVIPGRGEYRLQPVCVEDLARLAVEAGRRDDNLVLDAVGPEIFTFDALVRTIAQAIGSRARIVHAPATATLFVSRILGRLIGDVLLTPDEFGGLAADLLVSAAPPTCETRFTAWLAANADRVGRAYASELARHF